MRPDDSEHAAEFDGLDPNASIRLPSLPRRLPIVERIMAEAILDPQVAPYRRRCQFTFFCGLQPDQLAGRDGQLELVGRCLEWFVFDYIVPELQTTPAQHWLNNNKHLLNPQELSDATDCLNFILGIFEIAGVIPGEALKARDLLRPGKTYLLPEPVISNEITPGQLLLSRIFPHRGSFALSGMAVVMDESVTREINSLIKQEKLKPEFILPNLDAVELENLFGRSLKDIEQNTSLPLIKQRLKRYLEEICPGLLSFKQLQIIIKNTTDPLQLVNQLSEQPEIHCRHEFDLVLTLMITLWKKSQKL